LKISPWVALGAYSAFWIFAGALYGRLFMRTANDRRGGWLFGLGYGFLLWILGPVTILQAIRGAALATGTAAIGLCAAHIVDGLVLGLLFPWLHILLQREIERPLKDIPISPPKAPVTKRLP
jgi:hypothetical protein